MTVTNENKFEFSLLCFQPQSIGSNILGYTVDTQETLGLVSYSSLLFYSIQNQTNRIFFFNKLKEYLKKLLLEESENKDGAA